MSFGGGSSPPPAPTLPAAATVASAAPAPTNATVRPQAPAGQVAANNQQRVTAAGALADALKQQAAMTKRKGFTTAPTQDTLG